MVAVASVVGALLLGALIFVVRRGGNDEVRVGYEPKAGLDRRHKTDVVPPSVKNDSDKSAFVSLFNGTNLEGWERDLNDPGNWRVEDRVLVGSVQNLSHLYTTQDDFTDFHLRVTARINKDGNSGIIFRTAKPRGTSASFLAGYEAEICVRDDTLHHTGSLAYNFDIIHGVRVSPVVAGRWFEMEIIAIGKRFTVKVNGSALVDRTDTKDRVYPGGRIALQDFRNSRHTRIEFRKIEISRLSVPSPKSDKIRKSE